MTRTYLDLIRQTADLVSNADLDGLVRRLERVDGRLESGVALHLVRDVDDLDHEVERWLDGACISR